MKRLFNKIRHSLSLRLILLFIATAIAIATVVQVSIGYVLRKGFEENLEPHFRQYVHYLISEIGSPPDIEVAKRLSAQLPIDIEIDGARLRWSSDPDGFSERDATHRHNHGEIDGAPLSVGFIHKGERLLLTTQRDQYRISFLLPTRPNGGNRHVRGFVVLAIILTILYLAYKSIRRIFQPLNPNRSGIARIGNGELNHRIEIRCRDELGELGSSINLMADEIEQMLEAKRQLLLAISHELRSPIARAKVSLELLEAGEIQDRLETDLNEMAQLIDILIEGERLKGHHSSLQRSATDIAQLTKALIDAQFPQSAITLNHDGLDEYLMLDPIRVQLLLKNLIENALRYNRAEQGDVRVSLRIVNQLLVIQVSDHGEGIDPEHLQRLTEPFYRVDSSRQRQSGGFGLGLYLCRMICEAHGGSLEFDSQIGAGSTVTARLGLAFEGDTPLPTSAADGQ